MKNGDTQSRLEDNRLGGERPKQYETNGLRGRILVFRFLEPQSTTPILLTPTFRPRVFSTHSSVLFFSVIFPAAHLSLLNELGKRSYELRLSSSSLKPILRFSFPLLSLSFCLFFLFPPFFFLSFFEASYSAFVSVCTRVSISFCFVVVMERWTRERGRERERVRERVETGSRERHLGGP